jgi:hypothetical protein
MQPVVAFRRAVSALALLAVAAGWCWGGSSTAGAAGEVSIVPRIGGPNATFVARFVAPFPLRQYARKAYYFNVVGPCETDFGFSNYTSAFLKPGDTATLFMPPPSPGDGWCPGRYTGRITYEPNAPRGPQSVRRLFSPFTFTVLPRDRLGRLAARPDVVKFEPRVGSPRETFVLRFTASFRTGDRSEYVLHGRGPSPCRRFSADPEEGRLVRGDRAVIGLWAGLLGRRQWCPGRYSGAVYYRRVNKDHRVVFRRRVVSGIRFTVSP